MWDEASAYGKGALSLMGVMGNAVLDGGDGRGRRDREFKEFKEFSEFSECAADNYLQGILPKFPKFPNLPNLPIYPIRPIYPIYPIYPNFFQHKTSIPLAYPTFPARFCCFTFFIYLCTLYLHNVWSW